MLILIGEKYAVWTLGLKIGKYKILILELFQFQILKSFVWKTVLYEYQNKKKVFNDFQIFRKN